MGRGNQPSRYSLRWGRVLLIALGVVAFGVVGGIAAGWLSAGRFAFKGVFNGPMCYIWITALFFAYLWGLVDLGRFVLPPTAEDNPEDRGRDNWLGSPDTAEGVKLLYYHVFVLSLMPTRLQDVMGWPPLAQTHGLPRSFKLYRAGILPSHYALILRKGPKVSRVAGPGYVRCHRTENILELVDLRNQHRKQDTTVVTSDGIPLKTNVSALFSVKRPHPQDGIPEEIPYPYVRKNVFRLALTSGRDGSKEVFWSEQISPLLAGILVDKVLQYEVDVLFQLPGEETGERRGPFTEIRESLREQIVAQLRDIYDFRDINESPFEIFNVSFGILHPPEEIIRGRVQSWAVEREQRLKQREADIYASSLLNRRVQLANALPDALVNLGRELHTPTADAVANVDAAVLLRIMEALNRLVDEQETPTNSHQGSILEQLTDELNRVVHPK